MPEAFRLVDMPKSISTRLLKHYDANARALPWRAAPGSALPDPYRVWLSEIMLQQTTVAAVIPYFESFTVRWPSVDALAAADEADVMAAWAGLGYYSRARSLIKCARAVVAEHGSVFPSDEAALLKLPGIGLYTAAAITAIAFGKHAVVVDGNVERVMARYHAVEIPLPKAKTELRALADSHTPVARAGDYAQAVMDLGATICTPRSPKCLICPINEGCKGKDDPTRYPARVTKAAKPQRTDIAYWLEYEGKVFLIRRPNQGLLGGMRALPVGAPPMAGAWQEAGSISHIFTHFALTLSVKILRAAPPESLDGAWWPVDDISKAGLPSVFMKAAIRVLADKVV
jgi:A/G-specific adenine glycosylase